jgi:probable rRNA maturation factor
MSLNNIETLYTSDYPAVKETLNLEALDKTFKALNLSKPVSFVFMTDDELLDVNIQALKHDYYTDVITFDYSDDPDMECSEVLISVDRIKDNAISEKVAFSSELHRVCIHGMLHLAGHEDNTPEAKNKMSSLENHYLALHCST